MLQPVCTPHLPGGRSQTWRTQHAPGSRRTMAHAPPLESPTFGPGPGGALCFRWPAVKHFPPEVASTAWLGCTPPCSPPSDAHVSPGVVDGGIRIAAPTRGSQLRGNTSPRGKPPLEDVSLHPPCHRRPLDSQAPGLCPRHGVRGSAPSRGGQSARCAPLGPPAAGECGTARQAPPDSPCHGVRVCAYRLPDYDR